MNQTASIQFVDIGSDQQILTKESVEILERVDIESQSVKVKALYLRSKCYYDKNFFAQNITTRWTSDKKSGRRYQTPKLHRTLWDLVSSGGDVLCIVPRGFGKTTAVSKILVLWMLLFKREPSILLIMSKGLGEKVVGDIRRELETNSLIRLIWGDLVPISNKDEKINEKWRQRHLQLLNGCEVETITKGEPIRGNRPTKIIIDDPQENKDVRNPVVADEFYNWVFTSVYASLNADGGSMAVLGTLISNNCFVNKLKQEADQRVFSLVEFPAIKNFDKERFNGESLWPERWPTNKLKDLYKKMGQKEFMQEFMNVPLVLNGSPVFDEELITTLDCREPIKTEREFKFWVSKEYLKNTFAFIGIDLAFGSAHGDYTTIKGRDKNFNLLFEYKAHVTQDRAATIVDWIVTLCAGVYIMPEQNNALAFFVEARKYPWHSKIYREQTVDRITLRQKDELGWNTNARTKPIMIEGLLAEVRNGNYQVSKEQKEEMQFFYYDETYANALAPYHDDLIMGDALCVQAIKRGSHRIQIQEKQIANTQINKFEEQLRKMQNQNDSDNILLPL